MMGNAIRAITLYLILCVVVGYVVSQNEPSVYTNSNLACGQSIALGESVTFSCVVENIGGYNVSWEKMKSPYAEAKSISTNTTLNIKDDRFKVYFGDVGEDTTATYNLRLNDVVPSDLGSYECYIELNQGVLHYLKVDCDLESLNETVVDEGEDVTIDCYLSGGPRPPVNITRTDRGSSPGRKRFHIGNAWKIENVTIEDEGNYRCNTKKSGSMINTNFRILVRSNKPTIEFCTMNITYKPKFSAEFACAINSIFAFEAKLYMNGEDVSSSWLKDDSQDSSGKGLQRTKFHIESDEVKYGYYMVRVRNPRGDENSTVFSVLDTAPQMVSVPHSFWMDYFWITAWNALIIILIGGIVYCYKNKDELKQRYCIRAYSVKEVLYITYM